MALSVIYHLHHFYSVSQEAIMRSEQEFLTSNITRGTT